MQVPYALIIVKVMEADFGKESRSGREIGQKTEIYIFSETEIRKWQSKLKSPKENS